MAGDSPTSRKRPRDGSVLGPGVATREHVRAHGLGHNLANLLLVERLLDVVEGAQLDRLDRAFHRAVRGDHHHRHIGVVDRELAQQAHAVENWHLEVGYDDVDAAAHAGQRLIPVGCGHHVVAIAPQDGLKHAADVEFVVRDENALGFSLVAGHGMTLADFNPEGTGGDAAREAAVEMTAGGDSGMGPDPGKGGGPFFASA